MRYGWDLVVVDDSNGFEDGLMDLSNISDEEFGKETNSYYKVFACRLKYHRQNGDKAKYWLY